MNSLSHYGDVIVVSDPTLGRLAVACDSLGGIGPKSGDVVPATGYVVGRFTCRVPLMELMALGAEPFLVTAALAVEPDPTGRDIIRGVRDELSAAGLDPAGAMLASTEKNVTTSQTGLGITALGRLPPAAAGGDDDALRWGRSRPGDAVIAVGLPRVGAVVTLDDPNLADIPTLRLALGYRGAGDVVPVGSRGIRAEALDLASRAPTGVPLRFIAAPAPGLDLDASAGPSTSFLVTVPPTDIGTFWRHVGVSGRPCTLVGWLEAGKGEGCGR